MKMIIIYRATNVRTGEILEGTCNELGEILNKEFNSIRQAISQNFLINGTWEISILEDEKLLFEHYRRIGLYKNCIVCGKEFLAPRKSIICCSPECAKKQKHINESKGNKKKTELNQQKKERINKKDKLDAFVEEMGDTKLSYGYYVAYNGL